MADIMEQTADAEEKSPAPANAPKPPVTRSYWELAAIDFKKNKLGMLASFLVLFVATLSVFCPLIANNRPLYLKAELPDEYDEEYFKILDYASKVTSEKPGDREEGVKGMTSSFAAMKRGLAPEFQQKFDDLRTKILAGGSQGKVDEEALAQFETEFDISLVKLTTQIRYPALRALTAPEVVFINLYIFFVILWFLRRRFSSLWKWLLALVIPAAACSLLWLQFFPEIQDAFPYRQLIEGETFVSSGGRIIKPLVWFGENENITSESQQPPTYLLPKDRWNEDQHYHLLGTDTNGRDVLCRMIYGARVSMLVGIVSVSIYVAIGIVLGALAGFFGGWVDMALSRLIEIVICFPVLFLILSVQAFLQPRIINIMVALGLVWWTGVARLQRGEFLRVRSLDFVQAVRALGGSNMRIIFMHVLPNAFGPIIVMISFGIAGSILVESALSFLGFGVPQPTASWGDLLNNGRNNIQGNWWLTLFPGLAIFLTVTCFNLMGEAIRDALDPRRS